MRTKRADWLCEAMFVAALPGLTFAATGQPANKPVADLVARTSAGMVAGICVSDDTLQAAKTAGPASDRASASNAIIAFKGIPYAAPPIGPLRWRAPQPPVPWSAIRNASQFGNDCMQPPSVNPTGQKTSEDCLTVNVWTAGGYPRARRPVMVFIYGGAFVGGSAAYPLYDGAILAREGVVVVDFNYRGGIFGFLAHPGLTAESPQHVSGNYGLLDQIAALQWVKTNIAAFGGDPERVTVFGQSAGAVSIAELMTSPLAKGLFQRAILESPTLPSLASLDAAERSGAAVATDLATLRRMSSAELLAHNGEFFPRTPEQIASGLAFPSPIADGYVLTKQPRDAFERGPFNRVPMIIGFNADEGRIFTGPGVTPAAATALGDAAFVESARWIARTASQREPRTFAYVFTRSIHGGPLPPTHSEELPFVFGTLEQPSFINHPAPDAEDLQLSAIMRRTWARFADTGVPNGAGLPSWPRYRRETDPYLEFGNEIRAGSAFHKTRVDAVEGAGTNAN